MPNDNVLKVPDPAPEENTKKAFSEMFFYKIDRTMAIGGIILLGVIALLVKSISATAAQIITTAIGALAVYIGGRGKKEAT